MADLGAKFVHNPHAKFGDIWKFPKQLDLFDYEPRLILNQWVSDGEDDNSNSPAANLKESVRRGVCENCKTDDVLLQVDHTEYVCEYCLNYNFNINISLARMFNILEKKLIDKINK